MYKTSFSQGTGLINSRGLIVDRPSKNKVDERYCRMTHAYERSNSTICLICSSNSTIIRRTILRFISNQYNPKSLGLCFSDSAEIGRAVKGSASQSPFEPSCKTAVGTSSVQTVGGAEQCAD